MSEDQLPYYEDRQQEAWEDYKNLVAELDALRAEVERLRDLYTKSCDMEFVLRAENDKLRKGAPLGPIIGAATILEQEIELKKLRADLAAAVEVLNQITRNWDMGCYSDHNMTQTVGQARAFLARLEVEL